jgi:glycerol-1-phosphate dehydrogenase [NAD(P)+]
MKDTPVRSNEEELLERALAAARQTRMLRVREGVRHDAAKEFRALFGSGAAAIVADENTYRAAGRDVHASFARAGIPCVEPHIFGQDVYAEYSFVDRLTQSLGAHSAIPVAVGSGTINDLTKLSAHRLNRFYMVVATAASVDGYTAFGASITYKGSKQTFDCPAPYGVLADLETIAGAPAGMNASGYADLLAKNVSGADWILADALGIEPIDLPAWETVQGMLRSWVDAPSAVAENDPAALRSLVHGLMMSGFAMQARSSSRPSSGAEHQFSHLWDMQHHTYQGAAPSHGFKVGIGTLASLAVYENLLRMDLAHLDVDSTAAAWPSAQAAGESIDGLFGPGALAGKAREEMRAKYVDRETVRRQLTQMRDCWPDLKARLTRHLMPFDEVREKLRLAGCPTEPEQIGISRARLMTSYRQAYYIRRRFTVLDFIARAGLADDVLSGLSAAGGRWQIQGPAA